MALAVESPNRNQAAEPSRRDEALEAADLHLSRELRDRLRCPACGSPLRLSREDCECLDSDCNRRFRVVDGVPLLIDEQTSVFSLDQALSRYPAPSVDSREKLLRGLRNALPVLGNSPLAAENLETFRRMLLEHSSRPRVLVLGSGFPGAGMDVLLRDRRVETVESDVWLGKRTILVCDAHQIPFDAGTFDGVVAQALLEHVADPQRCVKEIHRVLRPAGLVYAETAFLQQVHAGRHDFTRFTPVGHRRLFRGFQQLAGGAAAGPAVALAWAWQHLLLSLTTSRWGRISATLIGVFSAFWLKYLDRYLLQRPTALDAASAVFFLGARQQSELTDREAIATYPGAQRDVV